MTEQPPTEAELRSYDEARLLGTMQQHQTTAKVLRQELAKEEARHGPGVDLGTRDANINRLREALAKEEERIEWLHRTVEAKRALES